uniref:ACYPI004461 protein n=1 Tax=Acyrthosiphon pisum TaxID=7029 RepID=C4WTW8_ACYPI|nr:ACYPI004461 [Acyrthosiphon pisum]
MAFIPKNYIDKAEDISELVVKNCNAYLPTASRLCMISTFIKYGLPMYFPWSEQNRYMDMSWNCGMFLATVFVLINLVGQLGGCILILLLKTRSNSLWNIILYRCIANGSIQHFMGFSFFAKKFCINRSIIISSC